MCGKKNIKKILFMYDKKFFFYVIEPTLRRDIESKHFSADMSSKVPPRPRPRPPGLNSDKLRRKM